MKPKKNSDPTKSEDKNKRTSYDREVLDYLMSRGIDQEYLGNIPTTRIIPGRGNVGPGFAGAYFPDSNFIGVDPNRANDPQMRMEEIIHSLQSEQMINPGVSGKINRLTNRLGVTESDPYEDRYAVLNTLADDPNRGGKQGRNLEAEAKLMSLKIDLMNQGLIGNSGEVSEEDLYRIQDYMRGQSDSTIEQRSGAEYFLQPYFRDLDDKRTRMLLLKVLNKI